MDAIENRLYAKTLFDIINSFWKEVVTCGFSYQYVKEA